MLHYTRFFVHVEIKAENRSKFQLNQQYSVYNAQGKMSNADMGDEIVPISKLYYSDWLQ